MITGVNHINLVVSDMDASFAFYKDVLGLTPLCRSRTSAYFLVGKKGKPGELWLSLDWDRDGVRRPSPCNTHLAFSVSQDQFDAFVKRLNNAGLAPYKENTSPGDSFYFLDPDGHKLEIHTGDWQARLATRKQDPGPWEDVLWFCHGA